MKYSDIISLRSDFLPVVKIDEETQDYWKRFIPTVTFENLLQRTLSAVTTNIKHERKSVWVRGTYGTGKSHACSVIKHLLCDENNVVSDYIEQIHNPNLKEQLRNKNRKLFPVVIRSTFDGKIKDIDSFNLVVEKRIKEELSKIDANIAVKSDFDQAIAFLENNIALNIDTIIAENSELRNRNIKNREDIIKKLKSEDVDFFLVLEKTLAKYNVQLSNQNISEWLKDVVAEIKNSNIADGVLILWDEFPDIIERVQGSLGHIQSIAELTFDNDIYLYLCGSTIYEARATEEQQKKTDDRFHIMPFGMEAITTYHIMSATIKKADETKYNEFSTIKMNNFANLITYLTDNNSQAKKDIQNLFPLHPYSAFLCSAIADQIGSSSRSVFEFLYDKDKGFLSFLDNETACKEQRLITADYLWNYFLEEFQNDTKKYGIVIATDNAHRNKVAEKGADYEKVFKGILLLNAMRYAVGNRQSEKIIPSAQNIKYLFEDESFENSLDDILEYFHQSSIIRRDPSDNFLIASSSLPLEEINRERDSATAVYSSDIIKIIDFDTHNKDEIKKEIFGTDLIRQPSFSYLSASYNDFYIRSLINSAFKENSYTLNIALLFSMNVSEKSILLEKMEDLSRIEEYKNVIFVVFDEVFDYNGSQKRDFIEYVASARAAAKYPNYREQATSDNKNANKIIINWVTRLKQGMVVVYFRGSKNTISASGYTVAKCINTTINHKIFSNAVDAMPSMRNTPSPQFWESKKAIKAAEIMLFAKDRDEAKNNFNITLAKKLLEDENGNWIVKQNLEFSNDAPDKHPFVLTQRKIDELLESTKRQNNSIFNLGAVLQPLTQPPFGLYANMPNIAVLAFALRKYVNELTDNSVPIDNTNMRDKVEEIFKYWQKGGNDSKLRVRFGSKGEKDLKDLLIDIFDMKRLSDVPELTSLINVRWGIVAYCTQKSKFPLWCLKYAPSVSTEKFCSLVERLVELIQKDTLQSELVDNILHFINSQKFELHAALLNYTAFEEGFKNFVQKIESVIIDDDWWDELKEYLKQNLQGEIGRWQESDVEKKVMSFYIEKTRKPESQQLVIPQPTTPPMPQPSIPSVPTEKVSRAKNKVTNASNNSSIVLKNVLLLILEKFPQTAEIIDENLE
jgi:hypothetical protein